MREFETKLDSVSDKITMCANAEWIHDANPLIDENILIEIASEDQSVTPAGRIKVYSPELIMAAEMASKDAKSLLASERQLEALGFDCYEPFKMLFLGKIRFKRQRCFDATVFKPGSFGSCFWG